MSPSADVKKQGSGDELRDLLGATQALHFALGRVERLACNIIWHTKPSQRPEVVVCIMEATKAYQAALIKCKGRYIGDGSLITPPPQGPNCRPGFHEEFGICVPDEENPGN